MLSCLAVHGILSCLAVHSKKSKMSVVPPIIFICVFLEWMGVEFVTSMLLEVLAGQAGQAAHQNRLQLRRCDNKAAI